MLLMSRLLIVALVLSSTLLATTSDTKIVKFLKKSFKANPNIVSMKIDVVEKMPVKKPKGWQAYIVGIDAVVKDKSKKRNVSQKMIWFSNGDIITQELIDMKTGKSLKDAVSPMMKAKHYKKENLIYGDVNAKHKVAIFSDPLCPFCRTFVPKAIKYMKSKPEQFALYYYHFPLPSLHPAAVELSKAAIALELKGAKDVVFRLYKVKVNAGERDVNKILTAFNKAMGANIKAADIKTPEVLKQYKSDLKIATDIMVQGTPTIFFDGKIDKSKKKYKEVK